MTPSALARWSSLLALAPLLAGREAAAPRPATVRVALATLHAAALTLPRHGADSVDRPFLLVSVIGPATKAATLRLPAAGTLRIHRDEALGARPLVDLRLGPGDTVRLLVSALEGAAARGAGNAAAAASALALRAPRAAWERGVASALAPVTRSGTRWLGSATLLLVDDRGTLYWRALECVAACHVLSGAGGGGWGGPRRHLPHAAARAADAVARRLPDERACDPGGGASPPPPGADPRPSRRSCPRHRRSPRDTACERVARPAGAPPYTAA